MAKPTDLSLLDIGRYPVMPLRVRKKTYRVKGYDTETNKGGFCTLIADSDGRHKIVKSLEDVFGFLCNRRSSYSTIGFFFNLEFDSNAIIKYLPNDSKRLLAASNRIEYDGMRLEIIPRKLLRLSLKGQTVDGKDKYKSFSFYDISQFYQIGSLSKTFEKVFKTPYTKLLDASGGFDYCDMNPQVIQYCIEDSVACQRLAQHFYGACQAIAPVSRFFSPASLGRVFYRARMKHPYRFRPSKLQQMALFAYQGGRIEVMQRGYFRECYNYDINSAYPSIQSDLKGFGPKNVYGKEYEPDAVHGFYKIRCSIHDVIVSPLKYRLKNGLIIYPTGSDIEAYVSKCELETLMRHGFDFSILEACHNFGSEERPFEYMKELYDMRMKYKKEGSPLQLPLKLGLNSSYGILIERQKKCFTEDYDFNKCQDKEVELYNDCGVAKILNYSWKAGAFFNPAWAAEITASIRCKLYEDGIRYEKHILKFSTDCISLSCRAKLDFGSRLGQYGDSERYEGLIVGNGVYTFKNETEKITKFRSFGKEDIIEIANENKSLSRWEYVRHGPVKLKEAERNDYATFNQFIDKKKALDINFDNKRLWEREMINFRDLLENSITSVPLDLNHMGPLECPAYDYFGDDIQARDSLAYPDDESVDAEVYRAVWT
jgi:hypothetical protein